MATATNLTGFTSLVRTSSRTILCFSGIRNSNTSFAASSSIFHCKQRTTLFRKSSLSSVDFGVRQCRRVLIRCLSDDSATSRVEDSVKKTVADNPVVVYSKSWCSYSSQVKSLFNRLQVEPLVIELDEIGPQGPQIQEVLEQITGQSTVPNVFIGGKHIGGCTDTMELHQKGKLQSLLSETMKKKSD